MCIRDRARDGEKIDNMEQALERAVANGVKNLVVQPTQLMHGAEYDEMMEMEMCIRDRYRSVRLRITRNWSYQKARKFKGSFCCAFRAVKRLFFRLSWPPFRTLSIGNVHSTQQKGLKQCVRHSKKTL